MLEMHSHAQKSKLSLAVALAIGAFPAISAEFDMGGGKLIAKGSVYFGGVIRADKRDPELIASANALLVGAASTNIGGKNQDDGNLNYARNDVVSETLKGYLDLEYKRNDFGIVLRGKAWTDFKLKNGNVPWGNVPNGFVADRTLSDTGALPRSKFSGVVAEDIYLYGRSGLGGGSLNWKVGNQKFDWGTRFSTAGGLNDLTPRDLPGGRRAGALPEEGLIPVPAVTLRFNPTTTTTIDAFYQVRFRRNAPNGCGTFFSQLDFVSEGCDKAFLGNVSDRATLASGTLIKRADTVSPSNSGQFGFGFKQQVASLGAELGIYAAQFHSRVAYYSGIQGLRVGAPFVPTDPGGLNVKYFTEFPEDIRMVGLTFEKKFAAGAVYGELTYRPNQPYQYNSSDLLTAFATPAGPTPLRAAATATTPGAIFHGFERHKAQQLDLGGFHALGSLFGAQSSNIAAEIVYKRAPDLPDRTLTRFRRADVYGAGPVNGVCLTTNPKQCSLDGFISENALGYRMRLAMRYPQIMSGVDFNPTLSLGHDQRGWSEDSAIVEGRNFAILSLKAEVKKAWIVELSWQPTWGGEYNNAKDRSSAALSVGYRF